MSELTTLARPYAKAAFEFALEKDNLSTWTEMLEFLALVVEDTAMANLLDSPTVTREKAAEAMHTAYLAGGKIVPGFSDQNGIREESFRGQWGGPRVKFKVISKNTWLKPLAKIVLEDQKQFIKSKYICGCCGMEREFESE